MSEFGKKLIEALNERFGCKIENTRENQSDVDSLFSDLASDHGFGWCDDCDERMPDEPMRDESRD